MEFVRVVAKDTILIGGAVAIVLLIVILVLLGFASFKLVNSLQNLRKLVKTAKTKSEELFDPLIALGKLLVKAFSEKKKESGDKRTKKIKIKK